MYKREISNCFSSKYSFFLFGPRQTGKTTALELLGPDWSLNLLDPEKQLDYSKNPGLLYDQLNKVVLSKGIVLIDEIQKVPALLDVVQMLMKDRPDLCFALSGSSARKLKAGAANLLGGRALVHTLYPLTCFELGADFDLETVLAFGSLPHIYSLLRDPNQTDLVKNLLKSYLVTYLQEEIRAEAIVRNLHGFQNFIEIASAQFAEQVSFTATAKDTRVSYSTVRDYYSILEDTLIGFFLPPCLRSIRKRMSHGPKFYFFDNGVTRVMNGQHRSPVTLLERGRLFEQWFIQEVTRINSYCNKEWRLSFWRTSHGAEVDLILERGREILCAIELKSSPVIGTDDLRGIDAFRKDSKKVPCFVGCNLDRSAVMEGVSIVPAVELLGILRDRF